MVASFLKCLDCLEQRNWMHIRFPVQHSALPLAVGSSSFIVIEIF